MAGKHISDLELLEYVAGRLDPARRAELDGRLARSPEDRRRVEALRRTWDLMGQWEPDTARGDVFAGVMERVRAPAGGALHVPFRWQAAGRVAAVWALAIGLGIGGGWLSLPPRPAPPPPEELARQVVQALYLDTVGAGGSVGVAESMLEEPVDEEVPR